MIRALASVPLLLAIGGCDEPPERDHFVREASAANGKAVIQRVGCGACHTIPGVRWPDGRVGPPLDGFAAQTMIAGRVPNRAEILAEFVRNAPAVVPGTGMPAMPITPQESQDVAAYLYTLQP